MDADTNVVVAFLIVAIPFVLLLLWVARKGLHWLDQWDGGK